MVFKTRCNKCNEECEAARIIICDECGKEIGLNEPHWDIDKTLQNEPEDMDDNFTLDSYKHICLSCKPLPEYKKKES